METAISIFVIPNDNSFRVLFYKIASVYILFENYIYILVLKMASPWNQHCADCIGTLSFLRIRVVLPVEQEYDGVGGAGVESGRRFVEEQGAWTDD